MGQFLRYMSVILLRLVIVLVVLTGLSYVGLLLYLNFNDWPELIASKSQREWGRKVMIAGPIYTGFNPNSPRLIFSDITIGPGKEDKITVHAESGVMMLHDIYTIFRSHDQIKKVVVTLELNGVSVNEKPVGTSKLNIVYEQKKWRVDPFEIGIGKGGITGTAQMEKDRFDMKAVAADVDFGSFLDEEEAVLNAEMTVTSGLTEEGTTLMSVKPLEIRYAGGGFSGAVTADKQQMKMTGTLSDIDYLKLAEKSEQLREVLSPEVREALSGKLSGDILWQHAREGEEQAHLQIAPLRIKAAAGSFSGACSYNEEVLHLKGELQDVDYGRFFEEVDGKLDADLDLSAAYAAPGALTGKVVIRAGKGSIQGNVIDLWSGDLVTALQNTTIGKNTPFSCAVGVFTVADGIATGPMVLDTEKTVIHGRGSINLIAQSYDLTFYPQPKQKQEGAMNLAAPLRITGPWESPEIAPETTGMIMKLGGMLTGSNLGEMPVAPAGKDFCAALLEGEKAAGQ